MANIGVPKERRPFEFRVGMPPAGVITFVEQGHTVYVERGAGTVAGFNDDDYAAAGARVVYNPEEVFGRADLLLKVARPLREELEMMLPGQALAGFLHLAAARQEKIEVLLNKRITAIAYEQVEEPIGIRPILAPVSQIGGRMAVQLAAKLLQNDHGGRGILLGGVVGVPPAEVVIIGGGVAGGAAAAGFTEVGALVTILDVDLRRLQELQDRIGHLVTMLATPYNVARAVQKADVLIGAVLQPGERAPIVVTRKMVAGMRPGSIIMDMSIDQGGCIETSRPTTSGTPTYIEEGVTHYCVPNVGGVLGRTGSLALYNGTFPYLESIARMGMDEAIQSRPGLERGLNTYRGEIVHLKRLGGIGGRQR